MKILVLGAGALGGYYGARLMEAGADVTFLVRAPHTALLRDHGLVVKSPMGDFSGTVTTTTAEEVSHPFDAIVLTCKAYDLESAANSIAPAVGKDTLIIPLLNGLAAYDMLDKRFGAHHVAGGVSYIATSLTSSGNIVHLSPSDKLLVGARQPAQSDRVEAFYEFASKSNGTRMLSDNIEQELWEKWVMICAGAAVTCLMRSSIGDILKTNEGEEIIKSIFDECIAVAREAGYEPGAEARRSAGGVLLAQHSRWAASMMRDIDANAPRIEADAIVGDMIRRGERYAIDTPLLRIAYTHLQAYQVQRSAR